jgi:geranylgeranyl pyrophosphate synthase
MLIGYHLRGDNLDMCPDSTAWGKVAGEDITTGRRTLLINYLLEKTEGADHDELVSIIDARSEDEDKKRRVYDMVRQYGGFEYAAGLAEEYNVLTKEDVERLHIAEAHKELLRQFSDFATCRRKV